MTSSIIMASVNWIARTFPEAPPMMWAKDSKGSLEAVTDHPLVSLLRRPNAFYSGSVLWMATLLSFVLDGNAYWIKVRNAVDGPIELWYQPHWLISPKWPVGTTTEYITHYEYMTSTGLKRAETSDVVHFRFGLDPNNVRLGLSPLKALFRELWTDEEASNFTATLLRNQGVPGLIISPDGEMAVAPSRDEIKEAQAFFDQRTTGDHRGRSMFMMGPTKVDQFGFNPEQMSLALLRQIPEERVTAVVATKDFEHDQYLFMCTRNGKVKRTQVKEFASVVTRTPGIIAMNLAKGDELVSACIVDEEDDVIGITEQGQAIRFPAKDVRPQFRNAAGVRGIRLRPKDQVMDFERIKEGAFLLVVGAKGLGKLTQLDRYPAHHRGTSGVLTLKITKKTGAVAAARVVHPDEELMIITKNGIIIRTTLHQIRVTGRTAQGVRVIDVDAGDAVATIAAFDLKKDEPEAPPTNGATPTGE
ncbi:MAG: phage portal protein [Chloroflexi bacterium]|nr:phage portal protein [Chloroflexota bacterium]